ncbi:sideroflexin-1 isoform X1 [Hetaerina americana]|uniref:sideroflexin-1 isoform X1 n=1 Tax=Hetaerina americana TaxID=62018 RepID=UPI003A7F1597
MTTLPRINIDEPRWDQSTYTGRAKHFFTITNPLNLLVSPSELDKAKKIVKAYRAGESEPGLTEDEIWRAKHLYDSAYHPDTGEKMNILGRMSAQVPMNMTITGCMMTFYKTSSAVVFWQWINQSFNALVNYTNRSGDSDIPINVLGTSYVLATGGALVTALGLNSLVKKAPPLIGRWVPFAAVAAANCVNIPMMRRKELQEGIPVFDANGNKIGESKVAAQRGIATVTLSRILMASPGMVFPPILMNILERRGTLARYPWVGAPLQVFLCGFCLTFATPMCCALFPQKSSLSVSSVESSIKDKIKELPHPVDAVYFNKGL